MSNVIIFGTNDTASLAHFYLEKDGNFTVRGFCVDKEFQKETKFENKPVFTTEQITTICPPDRFKFFAPLYDNKLRAKKMKELKDKGYNFISYVSSKATCWGNVGENCFIMENNVIQPFVEIGDGVICWSGNHIGHHSKIAPYVFFSSHVVLSGHCVVESYSWFGVNSTIKDHITIAEGSTIGMAAAVIKDTLPWNTYIGIPARIKDVD